MGTTASRPASDEPVVYVRALGAFAIRDANGDEIQPLFTRRKRRALFAYLALNGPGASHSRESLCGLFWPESTEARARLSLRQALHVIRRTLGRDLLLSRAHGDVAIAPGAVRSDVNDFERAIAEGRAADALALYSGPFLLGFSASGGLSELEWWIDRERARLHALATRAAEQVIAAAERAGDLALAVESARHAQRMDPLDERAFRRLVTLLHRAGDTGAALHAYDQFKSLLARELDAAPSAETEALVESVRSAPRAPVRPPRTTSTSPDSAPPLDHAVIRTPPPLVATPVDIPESHSRHFTRRPRVVALAALALIASLAVAASRVNLGPSRVVLAVGAIRVEVRDTLVSPALIRELLASDLARIAGIDVVSGERIHELLAQSGSPTDTGVSIAHAARRGGATEVLEAIISSAEDGNGLRIDMHRADLREGTIRGAHTIEGPDLFALADRVSDQVAQDLGRSHARAPLASVTSTSLVARRFYEEGLRSYYRGDMSSGLAFLERALREDSTFAMAAYYAARIAQQVRGDTAALRLMAQARRMSHHAPERERLLMETGWAAFTNDAALVAVAESLWTRYPLEVAGEVSLGGALAWAGERSRAIPHFWNVIERDSASLAITTQMNASAPSCYACEAFAAMVGAYQTADSAAAAERVAREWIARQPSALGQLALADVLETAGHCDSAIVARRAASRLAGSDFTGPVYRAHLAVRAEDFQTADRLLRDQIATGDPLVGLDARWWLGISLRQQGRLREALAVADRLLLAERELSGPTSGEIAGTMLRAQVLLELGRAREAAATFEAAGRAPLLANRIGLGEIPGLTGRRRAWTLTHAATAYAAAGDTTRVAQLADTVEQLGAREGFARDRRLHFYVRGLLLEARGDSGAAVASFRRAIDSPNLGFTRVNLELARLLIALKRPGEAIPLLESALRGSLEGSNFYVTRTELHAMLATALRAAGRPDSARVHELQLARAWRAGDAPFRRWAARAKRDAASD